METLLLQIAQIWLNITIEDGPIENDICKSVKMTNKDESVTTTTNCINLTNIAMLVIFTTHWNGPIVKTLTFYIVKGKSSSKHQKTSHWNGPIVKNFCLLTL